MQRPLPITLFAAVALALVLALLFAAHFLSRAPSGVVPPVSPSAPGARVLPEAADGREFEASARESSPLESAPRLQVHGDVRARGAASFGPTVRPVTLSGSVEVIDAGGDPVEAPGAFYLAFTAGERVETRFVSFADGAWSATLEASDAWTELTIRAPQMGYRSVRVVEPSAGVAFPLDGPLAVVLSVPRAAVLRVVDAASGIELEEVSVRSVPTVVVGTRGDTGTKREGPALTSPVLLDAHASFATATDLCVSAPGYAERQVRIDRKHGGTRWVALEPECELSVEVMADEYSSEVWLCVSEVGSSEPVRIKRLRRGGTFQFSHLRPGAYRVEVKLAPSLWMPFSPIPALAERELELAAGRPTWVRLVCGPEPDLRPAAAAGVVRVPASFEGEALELRFRPIGLHGPSTGAPRRVRADREPHPEVGAQAFAWSLPDLEVHTYLLEVHPLAHREVLQQPPGGCLDFVVDLTRLLELRVIDPSHDPRSLAPALRWYAGSRGSSDSHTARYAAWQSEEECWLLRAPPGPVHVLLSPGPDRAQGERAEWETIDLRSDGQVHSLSARESPVVLVRLRDGGVPVEFPPGPAVRLRAGAGAGDVHELGRDPFERRFRAIAPGVYTLEVDAPLGYRPLAPLSLDLELGARRTLELELERAHP